MTLCDGSGELSLDRGYRLATAIAQGVAIPLVAFWNFFANRLWTFKH